MGIRTKTSRSGQNYCSSMVGNNNSGLARRIYVKLIFSAIVMIFIAQSVSAKAVDERIYIAPAGKVDKKVLEKIKGALPGLLPMTVSVELPAREELSRGAYDAARNRYNAAAILEDISARNNLVTTRETMLVVTDADIYCQDMDFVFGLADPKTKICIVSTARLNNEFYGLKPDNALFLARVVKEASRQLGRVWGVPNCPNRKCIMSSSGDLVDIDRKRENLCHDCKKRIRLRYTSALFTMPVF